MRDKVSGGRRLSKNIRQFSKIEDEPNRTTRGLMQCMVLGLSPRPVEMTRCRNIAPLEDPKAPISAIGERQGLQSMEGTIGADHPLAEKGHPVDQLGRDRLQIAPQTGLHGSMP